MGLQEGQVGLGKHTKPIKNKKNKKNNRNMDQYWIKVNMQLKFEIKFCTKL